MEDFEKLGAFYLGKTYDLAQRELREELVLSCLSRKWKVLSFELA